MKLDILTIRFWCTLIICSLTASAMAIKAPEQMKCEALTGPLAIDNTTPSFSWIIPLEHNGQRQEAYQILVATTRERLRPGKADLWDSGRTEGRQQLWVRYGGKALASMTHGYWTVRYWNEQGEVSPWAEVQEFGVGILNDADWQADFIGMPTIDDATKMQPLLQHTFKVRSLRGKALLHVNSLGYHEVYVNGQRVGDDVLAPAVTESGKRSMIVTYDVTRMLRKGTNDLVVWLGKGWYNDGLPGVHKGGPYVRARLVQGAGMTWTTLTQTDATWRVRQSGYATTWRRMKLGGEVVDSRLVPTDMTAQSLDKMQWTEARVAKGIPAHAATPQMVEPNRIQERITPQRMVQVDDTTFYYDMGRNITGWTRISMPRMEAGRQVRISYADHLDGKTMRGSSNFDLYIASGRGEEVFCNKFNYHAYRYVKLTNVPRAPQLSDVVAMPIRTDYGGRGSFDCSDPDMTAIHDMVGRTFEALTLGGNMVDCPHIERLGYGGDGNASLKSFMSMYTAPAMYHHWLQAWADVQRSDGSLPYTAPNPNRQAGGGVYWCAFLMEAAWQNYVNTGDRRQLERLYPNMKRWMDYVEAHSAASLLRPLPEKWYLGDWATPKWRTDVVPTDSVSVDEVNNCAVVQCYQTMVCIANVLGGKDADAAVYRQRIDNMRRRIHQAFFSSADTTYVMGTQTEMIYPMLIGATPEAMRPAVVQKMKRLTAGRFGGHLVTGLVGVPVITDWATQAGEAEWMYSLLKKREKPGFLYMIDQGATTTWEHWEGRRSHIHNCFNGIASWFYRAVAGIVPDEGSAAYEHFVISPQAIEGMTWAEATKVTPYGEVKVRWERTASEYVLHATVPVGSSATVRLPVACRSMLVDGRDRQTDQEIVLTSGQHIIKCTL